jgi:glycine cleavage system regulatory protein
MLAQAPADRAATAKRLLAQADDLEGLGLVVEAVSDRARFAPVMAAITTAATPLLAQDITNLMKKDSATLEKMLRDHIASTYGLLPGQFPFVDGFVGESLLRVPPPSRK